MGWIVVAAMLGTSLAVPAGAEAKGCIRGAIVGGIAGHFAGHHGLMGAAAGCAVGHHYGSRQPKPGTDPANTAPPDSQPQPAQ